MTITSEELQDLMAYATGTEAYYRFNLAGKEVLITDGVKWFIEKAGAGWFVNDFLIFQNKWIAKNPDEYFYVVKLNVNNGKAVVTITDGDEKELFSKKYASTDCPDGEWLFYYDKDSNVLLWHGEY